MHDALATASSASGGPSLPESSRPSSSCMDEFLRLFSAHQRRLFLFIGSLVPDGRDAEDVFQETSLVLWREFESFQPGSNFSAWASQVALNQALAHRKRKTRSRMVFSDAFLVAVAEELTLHGDDLELRTAALANCVTKLPSHHQQLIQARYSTGEAVEQIAEELHRTVDSVYRMLSRIRQQLHDCVTRTLASE